MKEFKSFLWQEQHTLKSYEVAPNKLLKLKSLFNYAQDVAWHHANALNFGFDDLIEHDLIWVLSRIKLKLNRLPAWGEKLTIETWPKGVDRLFALRDFYLKDENAKIIGAITSAWLTVNVHRRRPHRFKAFESIDWPKDVHALNEQLDKITIVGSQVYADSRTVRHDEIDLNEHVNNAVFIGWMTDALFSYMGKIVDIKELQVNFEREAKIGDTILLTIHKNIESMPSYFIQCNNSDSNATVFTACIWL